MSPPSSTRASTRSETEEWRKYTILIVDDEPLILEGVKTDLTLSGFSVTTAPSGEAGLELLATTPVHVIISDQKMPGGMSGTEFLCRVRERYPHIITMILSAYSEPEYLMNAMNEAKTYYYLLKPWNRDDLIRRVTQALKAYHANELERQQVERLNALLVQSEKMASLSTYAASIAHNIRNMMLPLIANVDLVRMDMEEIRAVKDVDQRNALVDKYGDEIIMALDNNENVVRNVNDLIETIMALYRADQKQSERFDLLAQVQSAVRLEKMHRKSDNIDIHLRSGGSDFTIEALKGFVTSNIVELLKNAGDAILQKSEHSGTHQGNIWVVVEDSEDAQLGKIVRLTVKDDGCGMSPEVKKEIFAPLFTTKAHIGTGLGLAAVYAMVERHGGRIEVESELGQGTTFVLTLPKQQAEKIRYQ